MDERNIWINIFNRQEEIELKIGTTVNPNLINKAVRMAKTMLVERHVDEFFELLDAAREELGLPPAEELRREGQKRRRGR